MKPTQLYIYINTSLLLVLMYVGAGCQAVLEYPNTPPNDPTLVNQVQLHLVVNAQSVLESDITHGQYQPIPAGQVLRVVVEAYQHPDLHTCVQRQEIVTTHTRVAQLDTSITLMLASTQYQLMVWVDYVDPHTPTDLYYLTTPSLREVKVMQPMQANTEGLDCLSGILNLDLAPYADQWHVRLDQEVILTRPIAKYMLITTDIQRFATQAAAKGTTLGAGSYTVKVSYPGYMNTSYDTYLSQPCDADLGYSYTNLMYPLDDTMALVGYDYQFLGGDAANLPVQLQLYDNHGVLLNQTSVTVPLKRGQLTVVRGEYLTRSRNSGISIDNGYDNEIVIIIP